MDPLVAILESVARRMTRRGLLVPTPSGSAGVRWTSSLLRLAIAVLALAVPFGAAVPAQAHQAPSRAGSSLAQDPTPSPSGESGSAAPGSPATGAAADDGTRAWSVRPSGPDGKPDARTHFTLQGAPGESVIDQVLVSNASPVPATFEIYATDAFNTPAGAFDLLPAAKKPIDIGSWVSFPAPSVTIPAGGSVAMQFKIAIPANASPGDHAGGVVVALATGTDVRLDTRVAVRIYLRVPGYLQPTLAVSYVHPSYSGVLNPFGTGGVAVTYLVKNNGNIRLASHPKVVVKSSIFGTKLAETTPADIPELLPGSELTLNAQLDGVFPAGPVTVTVEPPAIPGSRPTGRADDSGLLGQRHHLGDAVAPASSDRRDWTRLRAGGVPASSPSQ